MEYQRPTMARRRVTTSRSLGQPVVRGQVTEQVAARIQDAIVSGELTAGDRLPALRALALSLEVSQTVVREAIRILAERGLLAVRPGSGTYVSELTVRPASESLSLLLRNGNASAGQVLEVRRNLEIEIAGLAAERASDHDFASLEKALRIMDSRIDARRQYIDADFDFHMALAKATRNPIFSLLTDVLLDVLQRSRELIWTVPGAPERGQRHHRAIYTAVQRRDVEEARRAMREHLKQIATDGAKAEGAGSEDE